MYTYIETDRYRYILTNIYTYRYIRIDKEAVKEIKYKVTY